MVDDTLSVVLAAGGPLVEVVLGALPAEREQSKAWRREEAGRSRAEHREVYGRYVAAPRTWQSNVLILKSVDESRCDRWVWLD